MHELPPIQPVHEEIQAQPWVFLTALSLWATLLAAGPLLVASVLALMGRARPVPLFGRVAPSLSLIFAGLALLFWIIEGYRVAQGRRWFRGAWILVVFSVAAFFWLLWGAMRPGQLRADLVWSGLILSVLLAGHPVLRGPRYRDRGLWPPLLLFLQLAVDAFLAGAALLVLALAYFGGTRAPANVLLRCVLGGICAHGILILAGIALVRRKPDRAPALREMLSGPLAARFWILAVLMGTALPIYILAYHFARPDLSGLWGAIAATLSVLGLLVYQDCCADAARRSPSG